MNTLLLSALLASFSATGIASSQNDTIDRFIVDGRIVDDLDGTEVVGIKSYDCSYLIRTTPDNGKGQTVIREHDIKSLGGSKVKDPHQKEDPSIDRLSYAIQMSNQRITDHKGSIYGGFDDYPPVPMGGARTSRSVSSYNDPNISINDLLVIVDGKESTNGLSSVMPEMVKSIELIKGDEAIQKYGERGKKGVAIVKTKSKDGFDNAMYIVNGKEMSKEELSAMKKDQIRTIDIKHTELDLYETKVKNHAQIIESDTRVTYGENNYRGFTFDDFPEERGVQYGRSEKGASRQFFMTSIDLNKCLVIVDGKEQKGGLKTVKQDIVGAAYVIPASQAIKEYGNKGKNGVILIGSKGKPAPENAKYIINEKEISKADYDKMDKADIRIETIFKQSYDLTYYFQTGANVLLVEEELSSIYHPTN